VRRHADRQVCAENFYARVVTIRRVYLFASIVCALGVVLGWHFIGKELIDSLQVEQPGNKSYGEYTFMRDASPWAGAAIGFCVGLTAVGITAGAARLLHHGHREARTDVSTPNI
jgi:hypothetical protein